jgi:hypothetical protein
MQLFRPVAVECCYFGYLCLEGIVPMLTNILVVSGCDVGVYVCAAMAADDVMTMNAQARLPQNAISKSR